MVEALGRAARALVPGRRVPAVEADVRGRARAGDDRLDEVLRLGLRRVDDHVGQAATLEEAQASRRGAPRRASSGGGTRAAARLPEAAPAPTRCTRATRACGRRTTETGGGSRRACRSSGGARARREAAEDLGPELARRPVDPAALVHRHHVAQILGQRLDLDGVPRHQPERLHVHREAGRRPLGPRADERGVREAGSRSSSPRRRRSGPCSSAAAPRPSGRRAGTRPSSASRPPTSRRRPEPSRSCCRS